MNTRAEAIFRKEPEMAEKIKLYGFNNLTKTLSFNIYDVCYAKGARDQRIRCIYR